MQNIQYEIIKSFQGIIRQCERDGSCFGRKISQKNWKLQEVAEHLVLSNTFLLGALNDWINEDAETGFYSGVRGPFIWPHPGRLEPKGGKDLQYLKNELQKQFAECLQLFGRIKQKDGKCRVAQGLLFLTLHINRHLLQLEKIREQEAMLKLESELNNEQDDEVTYLRDAS